jgi:hypothetical protein
VRIGYDPNRRHRPNPRGGPRWTFRFSDQTAGASFRCSLDGSAFEPCGSPKVYRHLSRGRHVFRVRSVSAGGEESAIEKVVFLAGRKRASGAGQAARKHGALLRPWPSARGPRVGGR